MPARGSMRAFMALTPCSLFAFGLDRATDQALAGALRKLHPLARVAVLLALTGTRMRGARAVILASLRDTETFFGVGIVGRERGIAQREQRADGGSQDRSLRRHVI